MVNEFPNSFTQAKARQNFQDNFTSYDGLVMKHQIPVHQNKQQKLFQFENTFIKQHKTMNNQSEVQIFSHFLPAFSFSAAIFKSIVEYYKIKMLFARWFACLYLNFSSCLPSENHFHCFLLCNEKSFCRFV
jgi:hypothetical protein